jgi:hypothetical protein
MVVRAAALLALAVDLAVYYAFAHDLEAVSQWEGVAIVGLLVIPATFALVGLALPARGSRWLVPATLLFAGLAAVFEVADLEAPASFMKLAAVTGAGWFFLRFFEEVSWVVLVALLIIPIDVYSVARGPTKTILEDQPQVFDQLSIAFPVPGEDISAQLGLPDVLFFALFLGAALRFGLRVGATWVVCALSFGATLAIAAYADVAGLPALPLLAGGFVLANADLLWGHFRRWRVTHRERRARPGG